jgi:hypothetical protein
MHAPVPQPTDRRGNANPEPLRCGPARQAAVNRIDRNTSPRSRTV